eukprot:281253-Prorocentrum_minimum.AAC.2
MSAVDLFRALRPRPAPPAESAQSNATHACDLRHLARRLLMWHFRCAGALSPLLGGRPLPLAGLGAAVEAAAAEAAEAALRSGL